MPAEKLRTTAVTNPVIASLQLRTGSPFASLNTEIFEARARRCWPQSCGWSVRVEGSGGHRPIHACTASGPRYDAFGVPWNDSLHFALAPVGDLQHRGSSVPALPSRRFPRRVQRSRPRARDSLRPGSRRLRWRRPGGAFQRHPALRIRANHAESTEGAGPRIPDSGEADVSAAADPDPALGDHRNRSQRHRPFSGRTKALFRRRSSLAIRSSMRSWTPAWATPPMGVPLPRAGAEVLESEGVREGEASPILDSGLDGLPDPGSVGLRRQGVQRGHPIPQQLGKGARPASRLMGRLRVRREGRRAT